MRHVYGVWVLAMLVCDTPLFLAGIGFGIMLSLEYKPVGHDRLPFRECLILREKI